MFIYRKWSIGEQCFVSFLLKSAIMDSYIRCERNEIVYTLKVQVEYLSIYLQNINKLYHSMHFFFLFIGREPT